MSPQQEALLLAVARGVDCLMCASHATNAELRELRDAITEVENQPPGFGIPEPKPEPEEKPTTNRERTSEQGPYWDEVAAAHATEIAELRGNIEQLFLNALAGPISAGTLGNLWPWLEKETL